MNADLIKALELVMKDADNQSQLMMSQIGKTPRPDWTQDKHDATFRSAMHNAHITYVYCQVRLYQLQPEFDKIGWYVDNVINISI